MKVEKYLIYKKGTNLVEGLTGSGMSHTGEETVLMDSKVIQLNQVKLFNSEQEVRDDMKYKKEFWNEYAGRGALYWYDDKTTPDELGILKITVEEI